MLGEPVHFTLLTHVMLQIEIDTNLFEQQSFRTTYSLAINVIENIFFEKVNFEDVSNDFVSKIFRKKFILKLTFSFSSLLLPTYRDYLIQ